MIYFPKEKQQKEKKPHKIKGKRKRQFSEKNYGVNGCTHSGCINNEIYLSEVIIV